MNLIDINACSCVFSFWFLSAWVKLFVLILCTAWYNIFNPKQCDHGYSPHHHPPPHESQLSQCILVFFTCGQIILKKSGISSDTVYVISLKVKDPLNTLDIWPYFLKTKINTGRVIFSKTRQSPSIPKNVFFMVPIIGWKAE